MNNVTINSAAAARVSLDQTTFQFIPKEYVRAARKMHQEKLEQERASRPLWKKFFGI